MKLLLDTHIWLWSLGETAKLSAQTTNLLQENRSDLWLSPVSIWEMFYLVEKGRLAIIGGPQEWWGHVRSNIPVHEAPFTHSVAWELKEFTLAHSDPADRFLVATARVFDLTLVTADERLVNAKACKVLANR